MPPDTARADAERYQAAIRYIRAKVDQLLTLMGTRPLRHEELDDDTLLELDPIGIVGDSFGQVIAHLNETNLALELARGEIRAIFDAIPAAVIVVGADDRVDDCNRQAREWFFGAAEADQVVGRPLTEVCVCAELSHGRRPEPGETRLSGRIYQVVTSTVAGPDAAGGKAVYLLFDVTPLKQAETGLRLHAKVFEHLGEGIMITDLDDRIVEVNPAFCRITGHDEADLLGQGPELLDSGLHEPAFFDDVGRRVREHGWWKGEVYLRRRDGGIVPLLRTISEVRDQPGGLTHHLSILTDITSLKETQTRLDFLAHHDVLTSLPNRLLFNDRLEQAIAHAVRDQDRFALLFIDLDRFKNINDSLGHHIGDLFLVEVAERMKTLVRRSDTVARVGGDEFVVLMERVGGQEDAFRLADKVIAALKQPIQVSGHELHMGCSIGIALFPEDGEDAIALMKNADSAMYRAKDAGRDGYARFSHELSEDARARLALENALRVAVRDEDFELHYQPILDAGGRVVAAEALVRWPNGPEGANQPGQFIPLAEETRLILALGDWVLREAVEQYRRWRDAGLGLDYLSVNISAIQAGHPNFADRMIALLDNSGLDGGGIQIELTENVLMDDIEYSRAVLEHLRGHGVRTAIDDFGTGHSSLAYLTRLPIDSLKVDRCFVRDIPADTNAAAIAAAVIGLARTLGMSTIAEGIETAEQEAYLLGVGCDCLQGFRYGRPMPAGVFEDWLRNRAGATG
jgi:diguanylate cyclase (GGDEF)-like protein/PAS domain S-box-containing protein